jgi:general secretion pathway protein M
VSLAERIERLEERERRLLGVLVVVAVVGVVLLVPLTVTAALHGGRSDNEALRAAITGIADARDAVERQRIVRKGTEQRYAQKAPPLATLLAKYASETDVEIPETQDRQAVPHGRRYEEKATRITLRKVGMLELARFMEKIERSGYPVSIGQLTIRKRGVEPNSYDVDMVVSAYERKAEKIPAKRATAGADKDKGEKDDEEKNEEEEEEDEP